MFIRFIAAVSLATLVTLGLLFTMQSMLWPGREPLPVRSTLVIDDVVRIEREQTVQTRDPKPPRPEPSFRRPDLPSTAPANRFGGALAVSVTAPALDRRVVVGSPGLASGDGDFLPIVKVAPVYPQRALERRLEGYVLVEFVVTANGGVRDVVVIESTAPLFERPAIEAALKFRYKPRVVNGQPVEVHGVRNKIMFEMAV